MAAEETATFGLRIDADAEPVKEAAEALEKFRASIEKSQGRLADYRRSMSLLKGSSDDVTDAKAKLKAAIEAEKAAITKANLSILKLGGSYDKLNKAHKKSNEAFVASKKAVNTFGGPLKDVTGRFGEMKELLAGVTSATGLLAIASVAAVAGLALLVAGAGGLVAKFTEWLVTSGDALRNMRLMREAASGNAKNSTAWGHAIDWMSLKIATSKDELNALVVETEKSLRGTRVTGQGMVDTWAAVAQASAAMGKDVGSALNDIITRGKLMGRFGINFKAPGISELQGTGITFEQVSKQLAKNLNIGLDRAQKALLTHSVTIAAGAKAIRDVVEKQFANVNAEKLLSIDSLVTKFKDNLRDWTQDASQAGGALEPLLAAGKKLVDQFGLQTESGQRAKAAVREYAERLATSVEKNLPLMIEFVGKTIDFVAWMIRAAGAVYDFATSATGLLIIKATLFGIGVVVASLAVIFLAIGAAIGVVIAAGYGVGVALVAAWDGIKSLFDYDWAGLGQNIVDGLIGGIKTAWTATKNAVGGIADDIKNAFKDALGIHSPSAVFAGYGKMTGAGYAQGVEASQGTVANSVSNMVNVPESAGGAGSGGSGGANISGPLVEINVSGGGNAEHTAAALRSQSLLDGLTHAVQTALRASGIPTGLAPASGG
jgi:hypothetical protein